MDEGQTSFICEPQLEIKFLQIVLRVRTQGSVVDHWRQNDADPHVENQDF
jgi:hypothetical protein